MDSCLLIRNMRSRSLSGSSAGMKLPISNSKMLRRGDRLPSARRKPYRGGSDSWVVLAWSRLRRVMASYILDRVSSWSAPLRTSCPALRQTDAL